MNPIWMLFLSAPCSSYVSLAPRFVGRSSVNKINSMRHFASPISRITARIVPSAFVDYERKKPTHRAVEQFDSLLSQLDPIAVMMEDDVETSLGTMLDEKDPCYVIIDIVVEKDGKLVHVRSLRESHEQAEKGLKRLTSSLMAELAPKPACLSSRKGSKKQKGKPVQTPSKLPSIRDAHCQIEIQNRSNIDLWKELSTIDPIISFPVHSGQSVDLPVESCPPTVLSIESFEQLEQRVFCGVPLVLSAQVLHANRARVSWFSNGKLVQADSPWFVPTQVGQKIQVVVTPLGRRVTRSSIEAYEYLHQVEALPYLPLVHGLRRQWISSRPNPDPRRLRVLTYNVLADQYVKGVTQQHSYCAPEFLHRSHRMPLLVHEILSYQADILCLQEIDKSIFQTLYHPVMLSQGYQGFFSSKRSGQQEGCAMFWSRQKFEYVEDTAMMSIGINDILLDDTDDGSIFPHQNLFQQLPQLRKRIKELGQVLQLVTLTSQGDASHRLVVANTHLYYHPLGDHIRTLQAFGAYRKMNQLGSKNIIFCGDLNSDPSSGAMQLLLKGSIDQSHPTAWENIEKHPLRRTEASSAHIDVPTLSLPTSSPVLRPSCIAPFTHCIPGFISTLDYILSSLPCQDSAPMPPMDGLEEFMPNAGMPSDHVSLVADFEW